MDPVSLQVGLLPVQRLPDTIFILILAQLRLLNFLISWRRIIPCPDTSTNLIFQQSTRHTEEKRYLQSSHQMLKDYLLSYGFLIKKISKHQTLSNFSIFNFSIVSFMAGAPLTIQELPWWKRIPAMPQKTKSSTRKITTQVKCHSLQTLNLNPRMTGF